MDMAVCRYLLLLAVAYSAIAPAQDFEAKAGILDLRDWPPEQTLSLRGEWAFHWQEFIAADKPEHAPRNYIQVPGTWNNHLWQKQKLPGNGYASYRLEVRLPAARGPLALYVKSLYRAADIWVNGERLKRIGRPARNKAGEIPRESFSVIPMPDNVNQLDIVVHISSFHHIDGGLNRAFELGSFTAIEQKDKNRQLLANLIVGATVVLAGIFLTISLTFNRSTDRVYAYGAGLSLSYGVRVIGTEKIWFIFNPGIHADWALRCEYYGMIFTQVFYLYVIRGLYPSCISLPACRLVAVLGAVSALIVTAAPAEIYAHLRNTWVMLFYIVFGYIGWAMLEANRRKLGDALPVGLTVWASLLLMANDGLVFFNIYQGAQFDQLAYFLLMMGIVAVLMGRLSHSANEADRLAAALKKANIGLQQRVTARTRELAGKVEELDQLNRQAQLDREVAIKANLKKTEFLGMMSHEVRTPLSAIQGGLQILEQESLSAGGRLVLDNAMASSASLLEIANNTLDVAKIETGDLQLRARDFCFCAWIDQLAGMARIPMAAKGLEFTTDFAGPIFTRRDTLVHGDSNTLRQILTNLLSNATKFTPAGSIALKITQSEASAGIGTFGFEVADSGIGIDETQQKRIFNSFFQANTSLTREHSGTGLGLSISQRLAGAMGAEIKVESQPGLGSKFYFTVDLPIVPGPIAAPEPSDITEPAQNTAPLHVLIAEDDKANRDILTILLEKSGHKVTATHTGQQAVSTCKKQNFDLVLLDIRLPGMDGVTACREIRKISKHYRGAPIIAVTANINQADLQTYLIGGLDSVLPKPVSATALQTLLKDIKKIDRPGPDVRQVADRAAILDGQNLTTLLESLGPGHLAEQLANLQKSHEALIEALLSAGREGDLEKAKQAAHKLKGNSAYQGKNSVALLCDKVERHTGSRPGLNKLIEAITRESTLAQTHLAKWIARHIDLS